MYFSQCLDHFIDLLFGFLLFFILVSTQISVKKHIYYKELAKKTEKSQDFGFIARNTEQLEIVLAYVRSFKTQGNHSY